MFNFSHIIKYDQVKATYGYVCLLQETVIIIAKLLLPEVYEKISTQELRALVVDKSMMNIYRRGEIIVIPNHSVGFLLEGSVTSQEVPKKLIPSLEVQSVLERL